VSCILQNSFLWHMTLLFPVFKALWKICVRKNFKKYFLKKNYINKSLKTKVLKLPSFFWHKQIVLGSKERLLIHIHSSTDCQHLEHFPLVSYEIVWRKLRKYPTIKGYILFIRFEELILYLILRLNVFKDWFLLEHSGNMSSGKTRNPWWNIEIIHFEWRSREKVIINLVRKNLNKSEHVHI